METPAAEVAIDAALVDRLVRQQHPEMAGPLALVANGWDNAIFRLGDDHCVRLPRRQAAVELIENEQRWLPALAKRVRAPIPEPVRAGVPNEEFPWPWTIARWRHGIPAIRVSPAARAPIAGELAEFFIQLHIPAPAEAPHNPVRGVPLAARDDVVRQRLATDAIPEAKRLLALWEELVSVPPWSGPPLWLHGDPHPANLLLESATRELAAVLDFGDLTAGDPATDLAAGWLVFDEAGRAEFRSRLAPDENTWARARGWALVIGSALAAHSDDNPAMAATGRHTLTEILTDPKSAP